MYNSPQASKCCSLSFSPSFLFLFVLFMSQMASAMLRGVSKYSLVHYWSLDGCQPLRCESVQYSSWLYGEGGSEWGSEKVEREWRRWGISAKENREKNNFFQVLLSSIGCLGSNPLWDELPYEDIALWETQVYLVVGFYLLTFSSSSFPWGLKYESAR